MTLENRADRAVDVATDDRLAELPESARTLATLLALEGAATPSELARRTGLSYRTVVRRLRDLDRLGAVSRRVDSRDARCVRYEIADM